MESQRLPPPPPSIYLTAMSAGAKGRLQRKLKSARRLQAPCYGAFNRWVFLAQHNRIMFSHAATLQRLQDEYESGRRSGADIKREAARIVERNVRRMSALSARLKIRINGREVFDLSEAQRQLWLKCVCPSAPSGPSGRGGDAPGATDATTKDSRTASGATCLIACRERVDDAGVVDVFFLAKDGKSAFQYQFGMSSRSEALVFSGALYRALSAGTISADAPVKGAFAILCINLSQTPNEQVKFRVIHGTVEPSQRRLRDVCIVRAQALFRGFALRRRRQRVGGAGGAGLWWQMPSAAPALLPPSSDSKKETKAESAATVKRRMAKKRKKERQRGAQARGSDADRSAGPVLVRCAARAKIAVGETGRGSEGGAALVAIASL